jgi:hypothetical protein
MTRTILIAAAAIAALTAPAYADRYALQYSGHVFGIAPIGKMTYDVTMGANEYEISYSLDTGGVLRLFTEQHIAASASGAVVSGAPLWTRYDSDQSGKKRRITAMRRTESGVAVAIQPRFAIMGDPPASEEQKTAARDPLSSIVAMSMHAQQTHSCDGRYATFDGRYFYDLVLLPGGGLGAYSGGGYEGPVLRCKLQQVPIAGYDLRQQKHQKKSPEPVGQIWFALVDGSAFAPPVKATLPLGGVASASITLSAWRHAAVDVLTDQTKTLPTENPAESNIAGGPAPP